MNPSLEKLQSACREAGGRLIAVELPPIRTVGRGCGKPCRPALQVSPNSGLMLQLAVDVPCGREFNSGGFVQEAFCDYCRERVAALTAT